MIIQNLKTRLVNWWYGRAYSMNPDVKKRWIKALESEEYKQGTGELQTPFGTYCCLGVLTDLYLQDRKREWKIFEGCKLLPVVVQEWAGIQDSSGQYDCTALSLQNDKGVPFKEIANIIDKKF